MAKKIDAPKAVAGETALTGALFSWAMPHHGQVLEHLEELHADTDDVNLICVRIIREADYQMLLKKAGPK